MSLFGRLNCEKGIDYFFKCIGNSRCQMYKLIVNGDVALVDYEIF